MLVLQRRSIADSDGSFKDTGAPEFTSTDLWRITGQASCLCASRQQACKTDSPLLIQALTRRCAHPVQMCILDGNAYDAKCLEAGVERDDDLDSCSLLLNNKSTPLLQPGGSGSHTPDNKVLVQLSVRQLRLPCKLESKGHVGHLLHLETAHGQPD